MKMFSKLSRAYHSIRSRFGEPFTATVYYDGKAPRTYYMNRLAWETWKAPVIGSTDDYGTVTGHAKGYSP